MNRLKFRRARTWPQRRSMRALAPAALGRVADIDCDGGACASLAGTQHTGSVAKATGCIAQARRLELASLAAAAPAERCFLLFTPALA
jgi:hypothetical protein